MLRSNKICLWFFIPLIYLEYFSYSPSIYGSVIYTKLFSSSKFFNRMAGLPRVKFVSALKDFLIYL